MAKNKVVVIGAGFAGLSTATYLADKGLDVTVLEKNKDLGGRARQFKAEGFTFDMGPSWYWMPDVFEKYFQTFGKNVSDYYNLKRLDPSYHVVFGKNDVLKVPANLQEFKNMLEGLEPGSGPKLDEFLKQAAYKYEKGINDLVYKPGRSLTEFMSLKLLFDMVRMDIFSSIYSHVRKFFKNERIIRLMEFPILFLGALPENTPALYSLMNYADISLGTWYPDGGMHKIVEGMVKLAEEKGVKFITEQEVVSVECEGNKAKKVITKTDSYDADIVVSSADYEHTDQSILPMEFRNYTSNYWENRTMAPSSLIFYLGLDKKVEGLVHHNLFFDHDFGPHAKQIYENPKWPDEPLFYVSAPSKTDDSVAPEGKENIFILMPVAPGLEDTEEIREKYFSLILDRMEKILGENIKDHVIYKRSFAHKDFINEYHSFKGNAYGLANTLKQTAILKPSLKNKKLKNFYYAGQLTVPGPGVPPSLISGQVVGKEVMKDIS
ncbi:phytoene desaturase family protein [Marivirga arenosa]|uniref:Phytoene desaturase family protein n=1 Tax=Marivirga arenosa TaxID=3059076 RepID=A0AA51R9W2_9BACT|nr:phytoene desaturase family protein [Marivirga sp. ABR2-2]WMN06203.1 phytoene desaturase family protein [Marivirga sp. ABR2-2]